MNLTMKKPSFFFDPFTRRPQNPAAQNPDQATMWLVRAKDGTAIGLVEKAASDRYSAHRNGKFIGSYPTKHAAGVALEQADMQEAGA